MHPGMDMTYALLKYLYGNEKIDVHFNNAEYAPHVNPDWDPYSKVFKVRKRRAGVVARLTFVFCRCLGLTFPGRGKMLLGRWGMNERLTLGLGDG